uniref:Uncharacterized protein n=1 Tax=Oryza rufipogon TaxID=4529 RepID=A0A0E0N724_ORYRU
MHAANGSNSLPTPLTFWGASLTSYTSVLELLRPHALFLLSSLDHTDFISLALIIIVFLLLDLLLCHGGQQRRRCRGRGVAQGRRAQGHGGSPGPPCQGSGQPDAEEVPAGARPQRGEGVGDAAQGAPVEEGGGARRLGARGEGAKRPRRRQGEVRLHRGSQGLGLLQLRHQSLHRGHRDHAELLPGEARQGPDDPCTLHVHEGLEDDLPFHRQCHQGQVRVRGRQELARGAAPGDRR